MTGKEAFLQQIAEVKAHMGELRSDGKSAERVLAARAAEPTYSQVGDAWDGLFAWGDEFREATGVTPEDIDCAIESVRRNRAGGTKSNERLQFWLRVLFWTQVLQGALVLIMAGYIVVALVKWLAS